MKWLQAIFWQILYLLWLSCLPVLFSAAQFPDYLCCDWHCVSKEPLNHRLLNETNPSRGSVAETDEELQSLRDCTWGDNRGSCCNSAPPPPIHHAWAHGSEVLQTQCWTIAGCTEACGLVLQTTACIREGARSGIPYSQSGSDFKQKRKFRKEKNLLFKCEALCHWQYYLQACIKMTTWFRQAFATYIQKIFCSSCIMSET